MAWWTWVAPFVLAFVAKVLSYHLFYYDGFFYVYGSYVVCLPLYFLWGPRVFPGQLLAEVLTSNIVGIREPDIIFLHGLANAVKPLLGYYLFIWLGGWKRKEAIDRNLIFLFGTLLIATSIANYVLVGFRVGVGDVTAGQLLPRILKQTLRDCLWGYFVSYQVLNWLGPKLRPYNLSRWPPDIAKNPLE